MKNKEFYIGVVAIIILAIISYKFILWIAPIMGLISINDATKILPFIVPVIVAIITIYLGRSMERSKVVQEKLREKKSPIYEELITGVLKSILDKEKEKNKDEKDKALANFLQKLTPEIIIWADDSVLKAWADFRLSPPDKNDEQKIIKEFEKVLLSIRKDLGHKNKNLNNHEVLKCFINDIK